MVTIQRLVDEVQAIEHLIHLTGTEVFVRKQNETNITPKSEKKKKTLLNVPKLV